jgi:hypothetical protein
MAHRVFLSRPARMGWIRLSCASTSVTGRWLLVAQSHWTGPYQAPSGVPIADTSPPGWQVGA